MFTKFNGERLRLARLLRGLTLQEVGDAVSLTRQSINQYETDVRAPAPDVLNALAELLCVSPEFFEMPLLGDVKPEQCHFRKRQTTPVVIKNRVQSYATILEQLVSLLREHLELPENKFHIIDNEKIDTYTSAMIEKIAEGARERWGLSRNAPIDDMIHVAENLGAVVTYFEGVSDKIDALSVNRKFPLIIRNVAKESVCRMRFDIAHEMGHLVLHNGIETGCKQTEKEADTFASAFLFPRESFVREFPRCINFKGINWDAVYKLKTRWKMSAKAIIYRAHYLGLINAQQYRSANVWFSQTRQTRRERGDEYIPAEMPTVLADSIELLRSELGISFTMLSNKLGIQPSLLSEVIGIEQVSEIIVPEEDVIIPFKF